MSPPLQFSRRILGDLPGPRGRRSRNPMSMPSVTRTVMTPASVRGALRGPTMELRSVILSGRPQSSLSKFPGSGPTMAAVNQNGPRVLVVDDEPNITDLVALALRYEGFTVQTAASGRAAVATVAEFKPALVILDIMLPDIDGLEVLKRLGAAGQRVPVIFLTAKDATEDKVRGLTVGGDDYVTKPFSIEELVARVRVVLRRHGEAGAGSQVFELADLELDD